MRWKPIYLKRNSSRMIKDKSQCALQTSQSSWKKILKHPPTVSMSSLLTSEFCFKRMISALLKQTSLSLKSHLVLAKQVLLLQNLYIIFFQPHHFENVKFQWDIKKKNIVANFQRCCGNNSQNRVKIKQKSSFKISISVF